MVNHPAHGGLNKVLGLLGGLFFIFRHPGYQLPNAGHLEEVGVYPPLLAGVAEGLFVHPGGAGSHHHPVEVVLLDVVDDELLAYVGTHELVVPGYHHMLQAGGKLHHLLYIHFVGDVDSTVADIDSHPGLFSSGHDSSLHHRATLKGTRSFLSPRFLSSRPMASPRSWVK